MIKNNKRSKGLVSKFIAATLSMAMVLSNTITVCAEELNPGEVGVSKSVTAVEGQENTYRVREEISAKDILSGSGPADVVLVVDTSGSMMYNSRMTKAKEAAREFVNTLLYDGSDILISVVDFDDAVSGTAYTNDKDLLNSFIDNMDDCGLTNMQQALKYANELEGRAGIPKSIVFISDGTPVGSYYPSNYKDEDITFTHIDNENHEVIIADGAIPTEYDYSKITSGEDSRVGIELVKECTECGTDVTVKTYVNVSDEQGAYFEANKIKNLGVNLYTVGIEMSDDGAEVLKNIQNTGFVNAQSPSDLQGILGNIAVDIMTSAGTSAVVNDTISEAFEYIDGTANASVGNVSYDADTKTFTWEIGKLREVDTIVFEYDIKLNDELKNKNGEYLVSETNELNFISYTGEQKTLEFPKEKVVVGEEVIVKPSDKTETEESKKEESKKEETKKVEIKKVEDKNPKTGDNNIDFNIVVLPIACIVLGTLVMTTKSIKTKAN